MSWEAIIDQMKEWVIAQAYATIVYVDAEIAALKAWVEAQLYLQKAEYPGYGMPVHVTGFSEPDVTCTYFRCGDHLGKPCYSQEDGSFFIWWNGDVRWVIGSTLGGPAGRMFYREDPSVFGDYLVLHGTSGTPNAASGYKYLLTSFVDRGDPAAVDWVTGDFTRDGAWHDLDLSAIVPAGAKAVVFQGFFKSSVVEEIFQLRKKGNANAVNVSQLRSQVAAVLISGDLTCPCDTDRFIQYNAPAGLFRVFGLSVKGWWL